MRNRDDWLGFMATRNCPKAIRLVDLASCVPMAVDGMDDSEQHASLGFGSVDFYDSNSLHGHGQCGRRIHGNRHFVRVPQ